MKPKNERRKDPLTRYLWGKIFDLEDRVKRLQDGTTELDGILRDLKKKEGQKKS